MRVKSLDGIRGWASLMILFHHLIKSFLISSTPEYDKVYLRFITDGHLAIMIFFVLSGFALSTSRLDMEKRNLALAASARYFRLAIPIIFTSLIAYSLLKLGLFFNLQAAVSSKIPIAWLGSFYSFDASLKNALVFSIFDVFFKYDALSTYNSSLWTMPIELQGSFLVFSLLAIFRITDKPQWKAISILAVFLWLTSPIYSCFVLGYLIAEINFKYSPITPQKTRTIEIISVIAFLSVILISTVARPGNDNDKYTVLMAAGLILSVCYSTRLRNFFTNSLSQFLGEISFPLYLIHIMVICSWSSYLFIKLPLLGLDELTSANINLISTTIICLLFAKILTPVEKYSIYSSKAISRKILSS